VSTDRPTRGRNVRFLMPILNVAGMFVLSDAKQLVSGTRGTGLGTGSGSAYRADRAGLRRIPDFQVLRSMRRQGCIARVVGHGHAT